MVMRKLLDFLIEKRHWILFILLEIVSFTLVYQNTSYQRSVFISSANVVTGHISSISGYITSYLNLRDINKELLERNGQLEMQVLALQDQLGTLIADSTTFKGYIPDSTGIEPFPYKSIAAKVVNNSVTQLSNYITLDKGKRDGIEPDMGVVSERGVVGKVTNVYENFSIVIPLLNPKFRLSGKVLGSSYFGSLNWNGRDPKYINLEEISRHVEFQEGDTIVTSGYSSAFPAGVMVGTIVGSERQRDDNFNSLKVELSTNFYTLTNVRVISGYKQEEQRKIEQEKR